MQLLWRDYSDSFNFKPSDLLVEIHKIGFNDTLSSIICNDTLIQKRMDCFLLIIILFLKLSLLLIF